LSYTTRHLPWETRKGRTVFPNGARMAVLVYVALEEWDWTRPYGPDYRPNSDYPTSQVASKPNDSLESAVTYGFRIGVPRVAEILRDADVKITFHTGALAAQKWPELTRSLEAEGHHMAGHSYDQGERIHLVGPEERQAIIAKSMEAYEGVLGHPLTGWVSPAATATTDFIEAIVAAGLDYHGDLQDDEIPYFIESGGRTIVEIPYRMIGNINDKNLFTRPQRSLPEAIDYTVHAFNAYYDAAATSPLIFNLGLHPYIIGRPDAAALLPAFLKEAQSKGDIWITTYGELADWWSSEFKDSDLFEAHGPAVVPA
jgi:allantoinase